MTALIGLFSKIKLLISDVDGVMTSGAIHILDTGDEMKTFHVHDGFGIRLLLKNQIEFAVITSRECEAVNIRMKNLGVRYVFQNAKEKGPIFEQLLEMLQLDPSEVAYVGDDWPDLPVLCRVGLPIAVANAVPEVKARAIYITESMGGSGAIREVAAKILKSQGLYDEALAAYNSEV